MIKIAIVGAPGSGKSTLAKKIAIEANVQHIELDSIFHGPNWTPLDSKVFKKEVMDQMAKAEAKGGWIADGNYQGKIGNLVLDHAEIVIWMHFSRTKTMFWLLKRTLARIIFNRTLWNGNKEKLWNIFSTNPEKNILVWTWTRYSTYVQNYRDAMKLSSEQPIWIEVSSRSQSRKLVESLRARSVAN